MLLALLAPKNNNYRFAATKLGNLALVIEYLNAYMLRTKKQLARLRRPVRSQANEGLKKKNKKLKS
jgi:hypothetical protein